MKDSLHFDPTQVYVIGAADFWMRRGKWPELAKNHTQRVRAAFERKLAPKIEREKKAFAVIERALGRNAREQTARPD